LQIARSIAATRNGDLLDNARLMALVSIAEADAGIAAWDMKFAPENNLWRLIHAIRFAAQPEFYNAGITRDVNWSPLIPTFHCRSFPTTSQGHVEVLRIDAHASARPWRLNLGN
jgi:hypothetical protein